MGVFGFSDGAPMILSSAEHDLLLRRMSESPEYWKCPVLSAPKVLPSPRTQQLLPSWSCCFRKSCWSLLFRNLEIHSHLAAIKALLCSIVFEQTTNCDYFTTLSLLFLPIYIHIYNILPKPVIVTTITTQYKLI